jgi:hypothetical protein
MHGSCETLSRLQLVCEFVHADCDGSMTNGCEAFVLAASACGACGVACGAGESCGMDVDTGAALCEPTLPIVPELVCVSTASNGSQEARFKANNPSTRLQIIPEGAENHFTGSSSHPNPYFLPDSLLGPSGGYFSWHAALDTAFSGAWTVRGATALVTPRAPECERPADPAAAAKARHKERELQRQWNRRH